MVFRVGGLRLRSFLTMILILEQRKVVRSYAVVLLCITQRVPEAALFACPWPRGHPSSGRTAAWYCRSFVWTFPARSAGKVHTIEMERSALPKAQHANCVSPSRIIGSSARRSAGTATARGARQARPGAVPGTAGRSRPRPAGDQTHCRA